MHFSTQWAVYCYSTCLRITPCNFTTDQKSARHIHVALLTQLPANTKEIDLAPLVWQLSAKAINIPLSFNSYSPKHWAYITFAFQETLDAAVEQTIGFDGHVLYWELPTNINKLCHCCGKLDCAPNWCLLCSSHGHSQTRDPVTYLREQFYLNPPKQSAHSANARSHFCSHSQSQSRSHQSPSSGPSSDSQSGKSSHQPSSQSPPSPSILPRRWVGFITQLRSFVPAFALSLLFMACPFWIFTFHSALHTYCKLLCTNLLL